MTLLVTCPNCGPREVEELRCGGESTRRPTEWPTERRLNDYVYFRDNVWGIQREWWFCRVCQEWFLAERHTFTNEVLRTWHPTPAAVPAPADRLEGRE